MCSIYMQNISWLYKLPTAGRGSIFQLMLIDILLEVERKIIHNIKEYDDQVSWEGVCNQWQAGFEKGRATLASNEGKPLQRQLEGQILAAAGVRQECVWAGWIRKKKYETRWESFTARLQLGQWYLAAALLCLYLTLCWGTEARDTMAGCGCTTTCWFSKFQMHLLRGGSSQVHLSSIRLYKPFLENCFSKCTKTENQEIFKYIFMHVIPINFH